MKRALLLFALVGGLGVPLAFTLLRLAAPDAAEALRDVQLPLWPMSRMFADDRAGRHWLYLPLAAVLSNALIYAAIGALSAWGRTFAPAFGAALAVTIAVLVAAQQAFATSATGLAVAFVLAAIALVLHHRAGRRPPEAS